MIPSSASQTVAEAGELPAAPGAYLLVIDLLTPLTATLPGRPPATLEEGRYLYMGSARGPGGIRARTGRHLKGAKTVRWHVDRLTNLAGAAAVIAYPDGNECALTAAALALPGASVPAPGFGSSDCPRCPAHLVRIPESLAIEDLPGLLPGPAPAVIWRRPPVACFWLPPPRTPAP
jgi:Uri superfamily endonuclease